MSSRTGWRWAACLLLAMGAHAQTRTMTLDVVVADKTGKAVTGLSEHDFSLLDNKRPQKIAGFREVSGPAAAAAPLDIIVVLDEINMPLTRSARVRDELGKFLDHSGPTLAHPMMLITLADKGMSVLQDATKDTAKLSAAIKQASVALRVLTREQGGYGNQERTQLSFQGLERIVGGAEQWPGRKLIVWMSPGWPLLVGPNVELTNRQKDDIFTNVVRMSDRLRRASITMFVIDPMGVEDAGSYNATEYLQFVKPVKRAIASENGDLGLQVLAMQSGGRAFMSGNDLAGELTQCLTDADAYYQLTVEEQPGDGPNELHTLEVKVNQPKATIRTRAAYYAQPAHATK